MTNKRLIAFLYRIIRDEITMGVIESHMIQVEQQSINFDWDYSNKELEKYCQKLSTRLIGENSG